MPTVGGSGLRYFQANGGQIANQAARPTIDIVLVDVRPQALHSGFDLFPRHLEGGAYGAGQLVGIVRIDDQGIRQLMARPGKTAQNQGALFVQARCNVLLGDQVHPIVKGGHEAKIGSAIIRSNFRAVVVSLQKHDRFPGARAEAAVDSIRFHFDFLHQILIAPDVSPAGRPDLNKGKPPLVVRILIEKPFDSAKPLRNALGVVDAVDSHSHIVRFDAQFAEQSLPLLG